MMPRVEHYFVECKALVDNPNQGNGPFRYIAHFVWNQRPEIQLQIAALPGQYQPGESYRLDVTISEEPEEPGEPE